jgi:hypothetical protein
VSGLGMSMLSVSTHVANGVTAFLTLFAVVPRGPVRSTTGATDPGHVDTRELFSKTESRCVCR